MAFLLERSLMWLEGEPMKGAAFCLKRNEFLELELKFS